MQRGRAFVCCLALLFLSSGTALASELAELTGYISDPTGARVSHCRVQVTNVETNVSYFGETNDVGLYRISALPVGNYRVIIQRTGFKTIVKQDIELHVQDILSLNFQLEIGSVAESVTVEGGTPLLNTESAVVSTVVDRKYVENIPMNGRSLQDLILLTPGVITNSPQAVNSINGVSGEFSVNGQRTESNYYSVDGVSANVGVFAGDARAAGVSGSVSSATALGTTQALVSLDALEEFRVQGSTYSAEYGRNPGGQFSFATRSGTNDWHGTAFDYLRNDTFDANNWFNNFLAQARPALRQNDFGGTLGGPIFVPRLYRGKDKTFFFFSYEGLRLVQPQPATVVAVPTVALRQSAPSALQPVLNAFPIPNCTTALPGCANLANGVGGFVGAWSNPSQLDATSIRIDHSINDNFALFFRFSDTPSRSATRQSGSFATPSMISLANYSSTTYTLGANRLSGRMTNELRFNYSSNAATSTLNSDAFGGAQPINLAQLQGLNTATNPQYNVTVGLSISGFSPGLQQGAQEGAQKQWNLVDTMGFAFGQHQIKFGADYRRLTPNIGPADPSLTYLFRSAGQVQANTPSIALASSTASAEPLYVNFSAFVQHLWRITPRLNMSMGLRWEVNPAPSATEGNVPYTVQGNNLATLTLAPQGTSLWNTSWYNIAPRFGVVYLLRNTAHFETVVKAGGGVFYDTGQQVGSYGFKGIGFVGSNLLTSGASFPLPPALANPSIVNPPVAPYPANIAIFAFPKNLQLPYTLQWSTGIEQALGQSQVFTISYVGSHGAKLLEEFQVNPSGVNPAFRPGGSVIFFRNGLTSDYDALQLQFQRRLNHGLQALASYTWSHSIDYESSNASLPFRRGDSDFDVRDNFSGALSYELPSALQHSFARELLRHWGIDDRFTARASFPVTLQGNLIVPTNGQPAFNSGLNIVPGELFYLFGPQYPGGRTINPAAFRQPSAGQLGDAPRNFLRGFGAWQMDCAIRREFPIVEKMKLQFRAEVFNIFNHADFGFINRFFGQNTFGQATGTLNQGLGILSPLYQMGGPRSMQFALKLMF